MQRVESFLQTAELIQCVDLMQFFFNGIYLYHYTQETTILNLLYRKLLMFIY